MKIKTHVCVLGLGYIGLPTVGILASRGFQVSGVDTNPRVVETINRGAIHIVEPDLDMLVQAGVQSGSLRAFDHPVPADVFVISVPTPFREGYAPDLTAVESAARSLAPCLRPGNLVILESTTPVGATANLARILETMRPELDCHGAAPDVFVAHAPERVLPGRILIELVHNDRLIGGINPASTARAVAFYESFVQGRVLATSAETAEMAKLTENAYRDVNIAFANELSMLCGRFGVDVWELIRLANHHPRVNILQPGAGVGGHCIAIDPWFLITAAPEQTPLMHAARQVNLAKPHWVLEQVQQACAHRPLARVACLGAAYKPDIDDLRESPALEIARELHHLLGPERLLVCEPHVRSLPPLTLVDLDSALERADVVLFLVAHSIFRRIPPQRLAGKVLLDICGVRR
ncbi:MAG: UDP-N-acetyl-D-mannosamine dehydrogenase [Magnetococcus sp. WYHC-3]